MPVILGFGAAGFIAYYDSCKKWIRFFLKSIIIFSIILNIFLLAVFSFTPWCQSVQFIQQLYKKFEKTDTKARIYYYKRSLHILHLHLMILGIVEKKLIA
jgi:hypothetical protein